MSAERARPASLILVTGGTGFVGGRVAARLAARGDRVRALVRSDARVPELDHPGIERIVGDFTDPETAAAAARGVDAVVHAAATSGPDLAEVRKVNTEGTRAVVEAALAEGVRRYVQVSTLSVYAPSSKPHVTEDDAVKRSGDPYGWTKAEADEVVLEAMGRGLPATIVRPGAILGYAPTSTWGFRVPERIRSREVKLKIDGEDTLPWIDIENLVDAILLALEHPSAVGRVYNAVDGHTTWRAYTDEVRGWFGTAPLDVIPGTEIPPGSYTKRRFDASRLRGELGYAPRRTYEQGMGEAAAYWKSVTSSPQRA